ncbi:DUF1697 domain-containing protein [Candidatus Saccharibacteria bacterium]|nr:MAG: DUF1697 domain-containing protein [Candidatus Saccharibacteria bacterium]
MKYVALLRGINVGGNKKVPMAELKACFEQAGFSAVSTYINSGNVVFESAKIPDEIVLHKKLEITFGFSPAMLILDADHICRIAEAIPEGWQNDTLQKSDVAYLFPEADDATIAMKLGCNSDIETAVYTKGALLFSIDRKNQSRSSLLRVIGTPLYQFMTVRNVNTARKLAELVAS